LHWATGTRDPFNSCHDYLSFGQLEEVARHFDVPGGDIIDPEGDTPDYTGIKNTYERAEHLAVWVQNNQSLKNSLPLCEYTSMPETYYHPPEMDIQIFESKVLSAVTGMEYDVARLWDAGESIWNLRRAIMVRRENRRREGDTISPVWFERTVGDSSLAEPLDRKKWDNLITRYYKLRGWDTTTGRPTRSRLESLGMKNIADKLA
jgi:aldehyde:ferredoxin oxidoreductase